MSLIEFITNRNKWYQKKIEKGNKKNWSLIVDYGMITMHFNIIEKAFIKNPNAALLRIMPELPDYFEMYFVAKSKSILFLDRLLSLLQSNQVTINIPLPDHKRVFDIIHAINGMNINDVICAIVNILERIGYDFNGYYKDHNFISKILSMDIIYPNELYDKLDSLIDISKECDIEQGETILSYNIRLLNFGIDEPDEYGIDTLNYRYQLVERYVDKVDINHRNREGLNTLDLCNYGDKNYYENEIVKKTVKLLIQKGYSLSSPNKENKPNILKSKNICNTFSFYIECGYDFVTNKPYLDDNEDTWLDVLFEHYKNDKKTRVMRTDLYGLLIDQGVTHDDKWCQRYPLLERLHKRYETQRTDCDVCAIVENVFFDKFGHKMCLSCIKKYKKCQQCPTVY